MSNPTRLHTIQGASLRAERRLDSWKEIAGYLNRTVRTVQRWEESEGLPVHRLGHRLRDSVYAYTSEIDAWLKSRPALMGREQNDSSPLKSKEAGKEPRGTSFRWLIIIMATAVVVIAGFGAWYFWFSRAPALGFAPGNWLVLADFDNQTFESIFDKSLGTAFSVSLQQSRQANLLPRSRVGDALRRMGKNPDAKVDEKVGREVCLREGAKGLIVCAISKIGRQYAISAQLLEPNSGSCVKAYLETVQDQDHVLDALGKLASQLRRDLGESLSSLRGADRPLPQVTTRSLEALRAYAEGKHLWGKGKFNEALALYRASLKSDPDFAMAHAALGSALLSNVYSGMKDGIQHYECALKLSDRITQREHLLLQAQFHADLGHVPQASSAYRVYIQSYGDDFEAREHFAHLLLVNGRPAEAIEEYKEVLRAYPTNAAALIRMAASYKQTDRPEEALPFYEKAFALEPSRLSIRNINHEYGFTLASAGNFTKARDIFSLVLSQPENKASGLRSLALLDMYRGKYQDASKILEEAIRLTDDPGFLYPKARNHIFMAILLQGKDEFRGSIRELDQAVVALRKLNEPMVFPGSRAGVLYARAGALEKAAALIRQVSNQVDLSNADQKAELHVLEGEIALAKGAHERAIELLALARKEANNPLTLASLCRGYDKANMRDRAIACYQELVVKKASAAGWEPQQAWLESHERLAELYKASGERTKACQALPPLASIWSGADANLNLKQQIDRLQAALECGWNQP